MRRAGLVSRAGLVCRDLCKSVKHNKTQLRDYMGKCQPDQLGSRHRDVGIPARWAENLPCNRVLVIKFRFKATWLTRRSIFLFLYNS